MTDFGNACSGFNAEEIAELAAIASTYLSAGGMVVKLSNLLGSKIEGVIDEIPAALQNLVSDASDLALRGAYLAAAATQADEASDSYFNRAMTYFKGERWHKIATGLSGAVGGAGGLATTAAELAATTTLIMRSIQQIASEYGEDIQSEDVRVQCLAVFGFGGPLTEDDDVETGLYGVRMALATSKTLETVLKVVLPRFGVVVTEKVLAQATPLLGAAAGATINPMFTAYYQDMAHVHFRLRRMENLHDPDQIRACFERIVRSQRETRKRTKTVKP
ncbi:EcsC family protein [Novosphingobium taihuense]|uniref:Uncharacterized protein (DUF697 family) n=1 Tax=Novosphingobium taihuense TaxID=260085 RepID=A0A7W7AEW7_9SPHN|nr:EcsC family protein [Novosphingobium taihuense]MBB4615772.1 uncharacterized protein (DUF697 family) [Novosphingobium taihuense]TWH79688.1 EcsC family protein [Novosphingobium taihuense]